MSNFLTQFLQNPLTLPLILFLFFIYKWLTKNPATSSRKLPPSPPKLPILGNLHQLGTFPHRSLYALSKRYGELMMINLGSTPSIVVSSADVACEIMKTHDVVFSNRPHSRIMCKIIYGGKDLVFSQYGEYWRRIRSICVLQLLSNKKVQSFRSVREEEINLVTELIERSVQSPMNLSELLFLLSSNVLCRTAYGKKYAGEEGNNFMQLLAEFVEVMGVFSMGDFIPWLGWVDRVSGLESKVDKVAKNFDAVLERVVQEHLDGYKTNGYPDGEDDNGRNKDFVDILLDVQRENPTALPMDSIKAIILDMFAAGTDTTYTLLDWTMTELLGDPQVMKDLQDEVRSIARGKTMVNEDDLDKMYYLKAVIKEVLRLRPPLPLLLFRQSSEAVRLQGYEIAARTQVIINAWAIQRDPVCWEEPDKFNPKRFLDSLSLDYKVQDFHFIPFGAGRRGCPGISFSLATAELALANLMYKFDWKLPDGAEIDASSTPERPGITVNRRDPLIVIPNLYSFA